MLPNDNFDLEGLPLDGGSMGVDDLALDNSDSLILSDGDGDLKLDDDEFELELTGSDPLMLSSAGGDEDLSESLFLRTSVDMVQELTGYAQALSILLSYLAPDPQQQNVDADSAFVLSNSEFPYMPVNVFRVFHKILCDLAIKPEYQSLSIDACVDKSLELLMEATPWTPKLNIDAYTESFKVWCKRFRKLASVAPKVDDTDLRTLLNMDAVSDAEIVYSVNTKPFVIVNSFFEEDTQFSRDILVDNSRCGLLCATYFKANHTRTFNMEVARDIVLGYLSSSEVAQILHCTQDELLSFSTGELLRRLLQYEVSSGIFYPAGIRSKRENPQAVVVRYIDTGRENGSIVAELLGVIATMMMSTERLQRRNVAGDFLQELYNYLLTYAVNPSLINPVFYGRAVQNGSSYELSYVHGDVTEIITADSPLCEVVGTKVSAYCVPSVFIDEVHGYAVCPPPQLVTSLRAVSLNGKMKVSGGVKFSFKPTVGWLIKNRVLAEDVTPTPEVKQGGLEGSGNSLLEMLLNYDNQFEEELPSAFTTVVDDNKSGNAYFVIPLNVVEGSYILSAAVVRGSGYSQPLASSGLFIVDQQNNVAVAQALSLRNDAFEATMNLSDCQFKEQERRVKEVTTGSAYDAFLLGVRESGELKVAGYEEAVKRLCEMSSLNYQDELELVQVIIGCDLYHVLKVSSVDRLIASRLLKTYEAYREARREQGIAREVDGLNLVSLKELFDIVFGKGNSLSGIKVWDDSAAQAMDEAVKSGLVTVDAVCSDLSNVDLDVIALQVLGSGQARRDYGKDIYMAFREVPGVDSVIKLLENKMIALHVLSVLGDDVLHLFSRNNVMARIFESEVSAGTVDFMHYTLVEKMHRKLDTGDQYTLPLTKQVLQTQPSNSASTLKYLILDRNAYSLLSTLEAYGEEYQELCQDLKQQLKWPEDKRVSDVTDKEFNSMVRQEDRDNIFVNNYSRLMKIVHHGLLSDIVTENKFSIIKAFDMFNSYYPVIMGVPAEVETETDDTDLMAYGGSMLVSYCPVIDNAANNIDGGMDRALAYSTDPNDFFFDGDLSVFSGYDLRDLRLLVGGE